MRGATETSFRSPLKRRYTESRCSLSIRPLVFPGLYCYVQRLSVMTVGNF